MRDEGEVNKSGGGEARKLNCMVSDRTLGRVWSWVSGIGGWDRMEGCKSTDIRWRKGEMRIRMRMRGSILIMKEE